MISDTDNELFEQIADIRSYFNNIIFGDFNLPLTILGDSLHSHSRHDLCNNLLDNTLHQQLAKSTKGSYILGFVLSARVTLIDNTATEPEFSSTNHRIITFNVNMKSWIIGLADFNKL